MTILHNKLAAYIIADELLREYLDVWSERPWLLLTVETEVYGDSNEKYKCTNERALPWLVRWARRGGTKDIYLAFIYQHIAKYFFPHYFNLCVPHRPATWAGSRAGPPVSECLSPRVTFLLFSSNRLSCTVYCRIEATAFFSTKSKKDAREILLWKRIII